MITTYTGSQYRTANGSRKRGLLGDAPPGYMNKSSKRITSLTQSINRSNGNWNNEGPHSYKRLFIAQNGTHTEQNRPPSLSPSPSWSMSSEGSECIAHGNVSFADNNTILDFLNTARDTQLEMVCSLLKTNILQHQYSFNNEISGSIQQIPGCKTNINHSSSPENHNNGNLPYKNFDERIAVHSHPNGQSYYSQNEDNDLTDRVHALSSSHGSQHQCVTQQLEYENEKKGKNIIDIFNH